MKNYHTILTEGAETLTLSSGKIEKYEYITGEEALSPEQSRIMEQAKFTYSPLGKAFEKQIKTIENQGEKQIKATEEHGKQLAESNALIKKYDTQEDVSPFLKQKEIFNKLTDKRRFEILKLSEKIIMII